MEMKEKQKKFLDDLLELQASLREIYQRMQHLPFQLLNKKQFLDHQTALVRMKMCCDSYDGVILSVRHLLGNSHEE